MKEKKFNENKFDIIQLCLNIALVAGIILNLLCLMGIMPQWGSFISLLLVIVGCVLTNITATGRGGGTRTEVGGSKVLATLTFITGALWVLTYGMLLFGRMDIE